MTTAHTIDARTRQKLEQHLRQALASPTLFLKQSTLRGSTLELRIGREMLGTVDQVDDEGERSWAVTLVVLEEDLAA